MKNKYCLFIPVILFLLAGPAAFAQVAPISNDKAARKVTFGNDKIQITIDYGHKANISLVVLNGQPVITGDAGVYSRIKTKAAEYSSLHLTNDPAVSVRNNVVELNDISYGNKDLTIQEKWTFTITAENIRFDLSRTTSKALAVDEEASPVFMFDNIALWNGAYQDYGGLAWFYLFNKKLDTYGVHSASSKFWNSTTGNGLSVVVNCPGNKVAMTYTRTAEDKLAYSIAVSPKEMRPRFDTITYRRLYLRDRTDVWAPYAIAPGVTHQSITLSWFNFNDQYGRGALRGINGDQVSGVLNTIARIGVIGKKHFGGNSWHTPYGPICLHEQYIAQMGLAINDPDYLRGYQECLDFYRDNAMKPDGRVWPRWAYSNEDMMPGQVTDKGFYEAQWGFLLDSNPDLVTNVVELYEQTGDRDWLKTHQPSCEKALDWLLARDTNNNGLVEMMTDSHKQKRGSDWIDIIWAAWENAFVNAKLYHALVLWADVEKQLGNAEKSELYSRAAVKLKTSFNLPVSKGGFWDDVNQCYVHWRDKDGSIHGTNMVTPVNFMAIGYGICDDHERTKVILDKIESQMQKENLFFWPLCMSTYAPGEGNDWQFPFPNYENGDIFLSWGALGVKAYASYKPELALKYVNNVLGQYAKDGLAFQRYGRAKQDGLGDDILSGNSLSVVGLYQAIYGINPMHDRFYLDPHITPALAGTSVKYKFRGQQLVIDLDVEHYSVSNAQFRVTAKNNFSFMTSPTELRYYDGNQSQYSLKADVKGGDKLAIDIKVWTKEKIAFSQASANETSYHIYNLKANSQYTITSNNKVAKLKSDAAGSIEFKQPSSAGGVEIQISSR